MYDAQTARTVYLASDVARELGCTPAWVRALTQSGRLRAVGVSPRGVHIFSRESIDAFLAERAARRRAVA